MNAHSERSPLVTALSHFAQSRDARLLLENEIAIALEELERSERLLPVRLLLQAVSDDDLVVVASTFQPRPGGSLSPVSSRIEQVVARFLRLPPKQQGYVLPAVLFFVESRIFDQIEAQLQRLEASELSERANHKTERTIT